MGKHNDKEFQDKIKMTFRNNLEKQFRNGLSQGMYASCKIICEKASDESKPAEDRVKAIVEFCQQVLDSHGSKPSKSEKAGN